MSPPRPSLDALQGPGQPNHQDCTDYKYAAHPKGECHIFINKLVNSTAPTASTIQARLLPLIEIHCFHALENMPTSRPRVLQPPIVDDGDLMNRSLMR
jgi:hypothetical protein